MSPTSFQQMFVIRTKKKNPSKNIPITWNRYKCRVILLHAVRVEKKLCSDASITASFIHPLIRRRCKLCSTSYLSKCLQALMALQSLQLIYDTSASSASAQLEGKTALNRISNHNETTCLVPKLYNCTHEAFNRVRRRTVA